MAYYVKVEPEFRLTDTNKFGGFLINSLRHKKHIKPKDFKIIIEGDFILVSISEYYEKNFGVCISKTAQYRFVKFLYDDFNDRMLDHVLSRVTGTKGDIRRELLSFRNKFFITEDELPFFSMKRQFERAKIELNTCKSA